MVAIKVTVGIPVYNAEKYLETNLLSVINQTFPLDDIEVICVNDGSTDRSADILESYAKEYKQIKVIHQENSGGPGLPRNQVIEHANGEFIFFVDSDDYLGAEAIERMYNMAMENNTDVVLGKMVGVNGRGVPKSMFKKNQPRTNIYDSNIIYTLAPIRMMRTDLIRKNNLRFPDVKSGEDQPFMIQVYLLANGISIVADYDCYYAVKSEGESASGVRVHPKEYYDNMAEVVKAINRCTPLGTKRYKVLLKFFTRHLKFSRSKSFIYAKWETEDKMEWFTQLKLFLNEWIPATIVKRLPFFLRLRVYLIQNHDYQTYADYFPEEKEAAFHVENEKVIAHFESLEGKNVPTELLNFTEFHKAKHHLSELLWDGVSIRAKGWFYHEKVNNQNQHLTVVFKSRDTGEELKKEIHSFDLDPKDAKSLPDNAKSNTGFYFEWKMDEFMTAKKIEGPWDLFIESNIEGYVKRGRIGSERSVLVADLFKASIIENDQMLYPALPYYTKDFHNLTVDLGGSKRSLGYMNDVEIKWIKRDAIEIKGAFVFDFMKPLPDEPNFSLEANIDGHPFHFPLSILRTGEGTNVWDFDTKINLGKKVLKKMSKSPVFQLRLMVNYRGWKQKAEKTIKTGA